MFDGCSHRKERTGAMPLLQNWIKWRTQPCGPHYAFGWPRQRTWWFRKRMQVVAWPPRVKSKRQKREKQEGEMWRIPGIPEKSLFWHIRVTIMGPQQHRNTHTQFPTSAVWLTLSNFFFFFRCLLRVCPYCVSAFRVARQPHKWSKSWKWPGRALEMDNRTYSLRLAGPIRLFTPMPLWICGPTWYRHRPWCFRIKSKK